jgi:hypothetical protein
MTKVSPTMSGGNGTLTPGLHDDTDNLINEEIARNSGINSRVPKNKEDDMYEGGEGEEQ